MAAKPKKKAAKKKGGFWEKFSSLGDKKEPSTSGNKNVASQLKGGNAKSAAEKKKAVGKKKPAKKKAAKKKSKLYKRER